MKPVDRDADPACIKTMSSGRKDPGRRARIFREATAYDTCEHDGIPALVESNAHLHDDLGVELYIATDYAPGPTVAQYVASNGPLAISDAVGATVELLRILEYLHNQGWVHRDVKPDNIILRNGELGSPVLVDFGIAFRNERDDGLETQAGEELGNRFLRLPELAPGGSSKQDPRSDLSFGCALLLFMISGLSPGAAIDGQGHMPHQQERFRESLSRAKRDKKQKLLAIFDRAFAVRLEQRHDSASSLIRDLEALLTPIAPSEEGTSDVAFIDDYASRTTTVTNLATARAIAAARSALINAQGHLAKRLPGFSRSHTARPDEAGGRMTLALRAIDDSRPAMFGQTEFEVYVAGTELVLAFEGSSIYRTTVDGPAFNNAEFASAVEPYLARLYRKVIDDPIGAVADRGYFRGTVFTGLAAAMRDSTERRRPLVAVVYDASHPELSRIDHILGNYLKYESTKRTYRDHFVTAIVPSSDPNLVAYLPERELESVHWLVFDVSGNVVESQGISGNPDDGHAHALRLAAWSES